MRKPNRIEKPIQLLVEGKDDANFFNVFASHLKLADQLQVQDFGGIDELKNFLPGFVKIPGFETVVSLGIVRDAEESAASAFQSVCTSLEKAGLEAPTASNEHIRRCPKVSVMILPDDDQPGTLETLLCQTFPDDPVAQCLDDFFACSPVPSDASIGRRYKARVHAYLAVQPKPKVSVGVAAQQGYWCVEHPAFAGIRSFLSGLPAS